MDVVPPPPNLDGAANAADNQPAALAKTEAPKARRPGQAKPPASPPDQVSSGNHVTLVVAMVLIVVIGLALLATYAFLKQGK